MELNNYENWETIRKNVNGAPDNNYSDFNEMQSNSSFSSDQQDDAEVGTNQNSVPQITQISQPPNTQAKNNKPPNKWKAMFLGFILVTVVAVASLYIITFANMGESTNVSVKN